MIAGKILTVGRVLVAAAFVAAAAGVASAGPDGTAGETIEHEVVEGDNLHLIAGYYYKDPRQWKRVFDRNSSKLSDPGVILPGTVLSIKAEPANQWTIPYGDFLSRVFD